MNGRFKFAVVASSTCLVVLLLFGAVRGRGAPAGDQPYTQLGVYTDVLSHIKQDYVEEPDMKAVTAGAINGMLEALDPFASYLNADQYKQYRPPRKRAFPPTTSSNPSTISPRAICPWPSPRSCCKAKPAPRLR